MTSESDSKTEEQSQSNFEKTVMRPKTFEEKAAELPEDVKAKINATLSFMESGMNQWEQVKSKGHTPKSFIEGFVHVLSEYNELRESGTDMRRAQMLTLMKMRAAFVEIAHDDIQSEKAQSILKTGH